jgi:phosphoglycolate phosphatase
VRLIVFDCDGTLVDSQHMIVEAMTAAFTASRLPVPDRALILRQIGLSVAEAMEAMTGLTDGKAISALCRDYRTAFGALRDRPDAQEPLFPGAHRTLQELGARDDVLLGLATGKSRRGVDRLLEREGLCGVFATIQTADDAPSKPHPAMLHQAMDEAGAQPEETVMIGDTSFDMLMARAAGASALGVGWGYHDAAELVEAGASTVLADFAELSRHLLTN